MAPSQALIDWLHSVSPFALEDLQEIPGDASFRYYYRLSLAGQTLIVMDSSQQMDCYESYLAIAASLFNMGLKVPEILAQDPSQGFMLITDLGDDLYLKVLRNENVDQLYKKSLDALAQMQACRLPNWNLPRFNAKMMQRELDEFKTWVLDQYLGLSLTPMDSAVFKNAFNFLIQSAEEQPQVFMHRDYHSANLLLTQTDVGILDFQDACLGPITYDVVSLLRDCYIDWPDERVRAWVSYYHQILIQANVDVGSIAQFQAWFDLMGVQRHLKALFIFTRKYLRDGTPRYLKYLPRTFNYVTKISARYPQLQDFFTYLEEVMTPAMVQAARGTAEPQVFVQLAGAKS